MAADNFGQARNTKKSKSSEQTQLPKPRSRERSLERAWPSPVGPLMPSTLVGDDGFHFSARARGGSARDLRKLTGEGIRSKDAAFDPAKWKSRDILASLAGLLSAPLAAATESPKRE
jgi:hypothetical protein